MMMMMMVMMMVMIVMMMMMMMMMRMMMRMMMCILRRSNRCVMAQSLCCLSLSLPKHHRLQKNIVNPNFHIFSPQNYYIISYHIVWNFIVSWKPHITWCLHRHVCFGFRWCTFSNLIWNSSFSASSRPNPAWQDLVELCTQWKTHVWHCLMWVVCCTSAI